MIAFDHLETPLISDHNDVPGLDLRIVFKLFETLFDITTSNQDHEDDTFRRSSSPVPNINHEPTR